MKRALTIGACFLALVATVRAAKTLDIWVIDVEGGKATLVVSSAGQSMLIDTGYPGNSDRDTNRIVEACRLAGVKKLDVLVTTHYDLDHVGNAPSVAAKIPVALFVDHGAPVVKDPRTLSDVKAYEALWSGAKHLAVKPGDKIPFAGADVLVVAAGGANLKDLVPGGRPNPACGSVERRTWPQTDEDRTENGASIATLFTFGAFRMLDTGDLTWNREMDLVCPENPIDPVDLFMVGHHGNDISNNPALVGAVQPRVAIMNNSARKIGAASVMKTVKSVPGLQALYLLHWSLNAPNDNPPEAYIANLQDSPDGAWIKVSADDKGTMVVTNGRTGESKTYTKARLR